MFNINSKIDLPLASIFTVILFISAYAFSLGESVFFGYPFYYVTLDIGNAINISLKLLLYYGIIFTGAIIALACDPKNKKIPIIFITSAIIVLKIISMLMFYFKGGVSLYVYANTGSTTLISWLAVLMAIATFKKRDENFYIEFRNLIITLFLFLLSSFLCGINYHSSFKAKIWETVDHKYLVGEYKGNFLLIHCINGRSHFTLEEMKGQEFIVSDINSARAVVLRCKK